jgi:hypothetical protein
MAIQRSSSRADSLGGRPLNEKGFKARLVYSNTFNRNSIRNYPVTALFAHELMLNSSQ